MDSEALYVALNPQAQDIVRKFFGRAYHPQWLYEAAHDITVDFLYFSKSFREVYEPKRKTLKPFFSSYVRKKCFGLRQRSSLYNMRKNDLWREDLAVYEDEYAKTLEMMGTFNLMRKVLRGKVYQLSPDQMKSLERAKRLVIPFLNLENLFVALKMHVTNGIAKAAMVKLRQIIAGRVQNGRT